MRLVIDASVATAAAATPIGFARFRRFELVAPPLMWIEAVSSLHAMVWRGELECDQAESMLNPKSHDLQVLTRDSVPFDS